MKNLIETLKLCNYACEYRQNDSVTVILENDVESVPIEIIDDCYLVSFIGEEFIYINDVSLEQFLNNLALNFDNIYINYILDLDDFCKDSEDISVLEQRQNDLKKSEHLTIYNVYSILDKLLKYKREYTED